MFLNSSVGFPPSEIICFWFGLGVASGKLNLGACVVVATLANTSGTTILYYLGRRLGSANYGSWSEEVSKSGWRKVLRLIGWSHQTLSLVERTYSGYGDIIILVGRNVPLVRSVVSIPAGMARLHLARFIALSGTGIAIWVTMWTSLGAYFGERQDPIIRWLGLAVALCVASAIGGLVAYHTRRAR
jgi:membrane protein DedA with SNARE-associated domain